MDEAPEYKLNSDLPVYETIDQREVQECINCGCEINFNSYFFDTMECRLCGRKERIINY